MKEIALCPICGEYPGISHADSRKGFSGVMCCGVTIWSKDNPSQWNQYAAAMELAKATADTDGRTDIPLALILAPYVGRVLEVFNG